MNHPVYINIIDQLFNSYYKNLQLVNELFFA